jgi:hypothetical protein
VDCPRWENMTLSTWGNLFPKIWNAINLYATWNEVDFKKYYNPVKKKLLPNNSTLTIKTWTLFVIFINKFDLIKCITQLNSNSHPQILFNLIPPQQRQKLLNSCKLCINNHVNSHMNSCELRTYIKIIKTCIRPMLYHTTIS